MVGKLQRRTIFGMHSEKINGHSASLTSLKRRWSVSELSILKREFRQGTALKVIAQMLGRTASSVNKVLSRSGIRYDLVSETPALPVADIFQIINYLKTKNYTVTHATQVFRTCNGKHFEIHNYKINNVPVSCTQLLIIANKLRIEDGLPIFEYDANNFQ